MFSDQKAHEISLALIKISVYTRRRELRHRLEKLAFELLEGVASRDFSSVSQTSATIESFVIFGRTIYEIEPVNAQMLIEELGKLNSAIRQIAELTVPDLEKIPNIESVFNKSQSLFAAENRGN